MSISPDFSPVLVFTKKYFMKIFGAAALGAAALGAPCLLSKSSLMSYSSQTASRGWAIWTALPRPLLFYSQSYLFTVISLNLFALPMVTYCIINRNPILRMILKMGFSSYYSAYLFLAAFTASLKSFTGRMVNE